jgi:hypothetical protein
MSITELLKHPSHTGQITIGVLCHPLPSVVQRLVSLINTSYALGEIGLWKEGTARTSETELEMLIKQNKIVVAIQQEEIVGAIKIGEVDPAIMEFGQLAVDTAFMNNGIGKNLIAYVENYALTHGYKTMRLEILYPSKYLNTQMPDAEKVDMKQPEVEVWKKKALLDKMYTKMGYKKVLVGDMNDFKKDYPDLVNALAVDCKYVVYDKPLVLGCAQSFF